MGESLIRELLGKLEEKKRRPWGWRESRLNEARRAFRRRELLPLTIIGDPQEYREIFDKYRGNPLVDGMLEGNIDLVKEVREYTRPVIKAFYPHLETRKDDMYKLEDIEECVWDTAKDNSANFFANAVSFGVSGPLVMYSIFAGVEALDRYSKKNNDKMGSIKRRSFLKLLPAKALGIVAGGSASFGLIGSVSKSFRYQDAEYSAKVIMAFKEQLYPR